jgi:hypothetical protein
MRGTYRHGLDGHYSREINRGCLLRRPFPETERDGEDCGRREMTCRVHLSASGEGDAGTLSGWRVAGPRAESGAGLNGLPRPFSDFLFLFSLFFFFVFLN